MKTITITSKLARECADAMITNYNSKYDDMAPSVRLLSFKELYENIKALGFEWLIATAKGDDDIRDITFFPSFEKEKAYIKKHNIGNRK